MTGSEAEFSVQVSDELRALYRAWRAGGGAHAIAVPAELAPTPPPVVEQAPGPMAPIKLMRTGLRPLSFVGAVAMQVSTRERESTLWHTLTVYVAENGGAVAQLEVTIEQAGERLVHARVEELADAEAFIAFLASHDPGEALPAPLALMQGASPDQMHAAHQDYLARLSAARGDYLRLVTAFCGPSHPAAQACARRLTA